MGLHYWFLFIQPYISKFENNLYRTLFGGSGGFVEYFSILTGVFVLHSLDSQKKERVTILESARWFFHKIFRIYVLYLVVWFYQIFILKDPVNPLSTLFMFDDLYATWPLKFFMIFYLQAVLALYIFPKKYRVIGFGFIYIFCSFVIHYAINEHYEEILNFGGLLFRPLISKILSNLHGVNHITQIALSDYMSVFVWSFFLYIIKKQGEDFLKISPKVSKYLLFIGIFIYLFISPYPIRSQNTVFEWGVINFILLVMLLFFEYSNFIKKGTFHKVMNYLGNISFGIFLLHLQVAFSFNPIYYQYGTSFMVVCMVITFFLAHIYYLFEIRYILPLKQGVLNVRFITCRWKRN